MNNPDVIKPLPTPATSARRSGSALPRPIRRVIFWTVAPFVGVVWSTAATVKDVATLIEKKADKLGYWLDR